MDGDLDSILSRITRNPKNKDKCLEQELKPGDNSLELNPFWKNGGSGVPHENAGDTSKRRQTVTGDGGLSWWTKALQRCKETAAAEGKSLEEAAAERYESLDFLYKKINEAKLLLESSSSSSTRRNRETFRSRPSYKSNDSDYSRRYDDDRRRGSDNMKREDDDRSKDRYDKREVDERRRDVKSNFSRENHERNHDRKDEPQTNPTQRMDRSYPPSSGDTKAQPRSFKPANADNDSGGLHNQEPVKELSAEEKNKLSAKLLRAEMMGDKDLVSQLKAMLDQSTTSSTKKRPITGREVEEKEILIRTNHRGGVAPFVDRSFPVESNKRVKKQKVETHKDGERVRYFHDDDQKTLEALVREEKLSRGDDDLDVINRMIGKGIRGLGDEETVDDEMLRNESKHKPAKTFNKQKQMAIIEQKKMSSKIADCPHCFNNLQKHLVVSMGTKALLCLPRNKSMVPGHCLIIAMQHVIQSTVCDEDVLDEIKTYKKSLVKMFLENDEDVIFMETSKNLKSYPHLVIECIPVPKGVGDVAPISFQKAINDCGPEWSNNKKLVTIKGGVKRSIPPGFPYFHAGFGLDDGYGHVIEDEESFPWYFGREIVGGLLDLEPTLWRRPRFDDLDEQRRKVIEFTKMFKSFDPVNDD